MKAKFALIFLMFAISAVVAEDPVKNYTQICGVESFTQSGGGEALSFITITFAIVSLAIGLTYMYSKFREDPATGTWAKDEAYNLIISVLLFAGILVFFTGACTIAQGYAGQSPIVASQNYINSLARANGLNLLRTLTMDSISDQLDATKYLYTGLTPFWGNGVAMRGDRKAHSAHREYLIDLYLPIIASLTAQGYVLQGIAWIGASVLLPFAFVLRLLPFTREFGNMLIALFFALYIVVPTMYAMSGQVFDEKINKLNAPYTVDVRLEKFCSYGLDNTQACTSPTTTVLYRIGSTIPQAIFLPNLVIIVAVTCIMAMSKALRAIAV
ncbi:MAG: hypothetical protein WCY41_04135 [Candidatus Micrarchaeia archaeon]